MYLVGLFPGDFLGQSADLVCFSQDIFWKTKDSRETSAKKLPRKEEKRRGVKMPPLRQPKLLHDLGDWYIFSPQVTHTKAHES